MGMFDYVECKYPLPDTPPDIQTIRFQTKSFDDRGLELYIIEESGRLAYYEGHDRNKKPIYLDEFTGAVNFYGSADPDNWFEYIALYRQGKLLSIDRTRDRG